MNSALAKLNLKYPNTFNVLSAEGNGNTTIELDLDKLWYEHFVNKSFPILKRDFYTGSLFQADQIEVIPQLKMSFERLDSFTSIFNKLQAFLGTIQVIFSNTEGFFSQNEFQTKLNLYLQDEEKAEKLSKFILSSYSGRLIQPGVVESNAFLQQRRTIDGYEYRVFNTQYLANFTAILKRLNILFSNSEDSVVEKYVTNKESNTINYVRLGYFLEMLELGSFEIKGGENPMVFVRINDPNRIEKDSNNEKYSNSLLSKTLERHYLSNQIFDHFFLRSFSNEERWNFIEDFFLGLDVDQLLEKYKGGETNNIDIIETLKKKALSKVKISINFDDHSNVHIFHPKTDRTYQLKDLLTIDNGNQINTMSISEWLREDPVILDMTRRNNSLKFNKEAYELLLSKLNAFHPDYLKDKLGLKVRIKFKGYDNLVQASVPFYNQPIVFYKWWCQNPDSVFLSLEERIELFDKVYMSKPFLLKREHKKIINKA